MPSPDRATFERLVLAHAEDAYALARWLVGNEHDAADVTQEALMSAYKHFASCRGVHVRAWLMTIVRNSAYSWLRSHHSTTELDSMSDADQPVASEPGPIAALAAREDRAAVQNALEQLPLAIRETIVLRELQGLSYREISSISRIPIGTVMSRLSRGRQILMQLLLPTTGEA
jgi:RNA polymerase sigma-70 factor (ECF subfamily)